ncbi:DivIVA domain-containing protein [Geodermatophilus sp. DSM 44513]|uniref:DivIVA domain-containing protein n=1 Tax=Geodermatophilus sp. DSM 44513 TaxID=1528104 RepID=UPI00126D6A2F|nr:DivIVA domain-containing protein [Geodermatophilus sp. DSM 44513]WNV76587.1 DivIVA domain-containing protein [Geodermatophilus sp. DSM 44513]
MLDAVVVVLTVLVVGALLFLGGSVLLGRGETSPPADADRSPLELPVDRPVTADDVRGVRMSVTVRGYRMTEVDWLLEELARALEERDGEVAALRARLEEAGRATPGAEDAPPVGAGGNGSHGDA